MKTKLLLAAALVGAASLSAQAGVHFGFGVGFPLPLPVVTFAAPAPVVAPQYCAPDVLVAAPACPGPDYAWVPGYWNVLGRDRVWVGGSWSHRPTHVVYGGGYGYGHGYDHDRGYNHGGYRR